MIVNEGHAERWDCHAHRDKLRVSDNATVYHREHGQLCFWESHYDCIIYYPIRFNDKAAAQRWVEKGCIAEIQEGMGILHVGFTVECFRKLPCSTD
jgi:hypothetical protein